MNPKPPSEISGNLSISDRSVEQMRLFIDAYARLARFGLPGDSTAHPDLNIKILCYVEENAASAFAFARKLLEVRDPQALFTLQTEFIQEQLKAMAEQIQDIGKTTTTLIGTATGLTKNGPSS